MRRFLEESCSWLLDFTESSGTPILAGSDLGHPAKSPPGRPICPDLFDPPIPLLTPTLSEFCGNQEGAKNQSGTSASLITITPAQDPDRAEEPVVGASLACIESDHGHFVPRADLPNVCHGYFERRQVISLLRAPFDPALWFSGISRGTLFS